MFRHARARLLPSGCRSCRLLQDSSSPGRPLRRHRRDRRTLRVLGEDRRHRALDGSSSGRRLVCSADLQDRRRVGFHEAAIDRQVLALHQSHCHTLPHDQFKQLLEQLRFLKPPMTVLGKCRVMWDLKTNLHPALFSRSIKVLLSSVPSLFV
jgi:hypothetical protein